MTHPLNLRLCFRRQRERDSIYSPARLVNLLRVIALPKSESPEMLARSAEFSRPSLGQKTSASSSVRRSAAPKARRQRELAADIQQHLTTRQQPTASDWHSQSEAQRLRRTVEAAENRLDIAPNCDSTHALDKLLMYHLEILPRRRDKQRRRY
ncbi:hypothetical protein B0H13DRAFT_1918134 [Mycena leptocephala]|nr:hypothetical protein B0H13DRAFT_1918134 [Mycena leptocephala]